MLTPELQEFAKILVQQVRDTAVRSCDANLRPDVTHVVAKRWKAAERDSNVESIASVLVPDIVDETVSQLLRAIDQGLLKLSFSASNGKTVDLPSDGLGELSGWYMGSSGWRATYSNQRFSDDFSDLR
jgi:hypothetical protein